MKDATLADFTRADLLVPRLLATTRDAALAELALCLHRAGVVPRTETFLAACLARERTAPTTVGRGVAMPHVRGDLPALAFALGHAAPALDWAGEPVDIVWLMAVPTSAATAYMAVLRVVARATLDAGFVAGLRAADTDTAMLKLLSSQRFTAPPTP